MLSRRTLIGVVGAALAAGTEALSASARGDAGDEAKRAHNFGLAGGETIVFVGDSITQAGTYIMYLDAYLRTRFPERTFRLINSGLSSETLSGLTETDHPGPRPVLFTRFPSDVADYNPSLVVACYGINDGIYHPYSLDRFERFQRGVQELIDRTRRQTKARLLIVTPPVCDSFNAGQPDERPYETYGYKKPFADYDQVLTKYADWLHAMHVGGVEVADLHTRMKNHLLTRRKTDPNFRMQGDAIHPDGTGHLLIAMAILQAWNAPALVDEASVDSQGNRVIMGDVRRLSVDVSGTSFAWTSRVPMPIDPNWDPASLALEKFTQTLNRTTLTVTRLRMPAYMLYVDDVDCGRFTPKQLHDGLDVTTLPNFPTLARSQQILPLVQQWHRLGYAPYHKTNPAPVEAERTVIETKLRDLCKPVPLSIRLIPTT